MTSPTPDSHVYLFGTCLIDLLDPDAGVASVTLLQEAGIGVIFPQNQSCCGQPAFNSGYRREAREVARAQLDCFPKPWPIIVPSASCAGMMKHHWPELFEGDRDEARAVEIAGRVHELTEYLVEHLDYHPVDRGKPVTVAIHSSCSALREMGVADHIETLVGHLDRVTLVEQEYKRECCGFGGTFAVKQPDISGAMATEKADALRRSGAGLVISQDRGCLMNIGGVFSKQGEGPGCRHIADFLVERTREQG